MIIGLVLAGGKSSRMGSDKALLKIQDKTFLQRAVNLLEAITSTVWVSGAYEGYRCIQDTFKAAGPIGGIYAAVIKFKELKNNGLYFLIIPVDMPLLTPAPLQALIDLAKKFPAGQAYHYVDNPFPLLLKLTSQLELLLLTQLKSNTHQEKSMRWLLNNLHSQALPLTPDRIQEFKNINVLENYYSLDLS